MDEPSIDASATKTIVLDIGIWETFGSSSLKGILLEKYPDVTYGDDITIEFVETTIQWRQDNGGPRLIMAPEFMPLCFAEDLHWMMHQFTITLRSRGLKQ